MKKLLIFSLVSLGINASETVIGGLEPEVEKLKLATEKPYDEAVASKVVKDILTNPKSIWLDETSAYILSKDLSKSIAQLILKDTNFKYILKPDDVVLSHRKIVTSAVFSPDGETIVTASDDETAKLWDLKGKLLATLTGHEKELRSAIFSPDGKAIVTASDDGTAKVWNLKGELLATLTGHKYDVISAVFSPDDKTIVTASSDKTAKVWNLEGKLLATLTGHKDYVWSAVFSPDGKRVVTVSSDGTAIISYVSDPFLSREITLPQAVILLAINTIKWETKDGKFDFTECPHLQQYYDRFPDYIQEKLDPYVVMVPSDERV